MSRRSIALLASGLMLLGLAIGGYLLGQAGATDEAEANAVRKDAANNGFIEGLATGRKAGIAKGIRSGLATGRRAGRASGAKRGLNSGSEAVIRREEQAAQVTAEAAANVAAEEAAEAEQLYNETHVVPYPSTSPPPDGSSGVAPGCYPVEGVPCD